MVSPVGALGDIGTALFGVIGLLAALRRRDTTGEGGYVDVAMFDSMVSFADVVVNWWSMGERPDPTQGLSMILDGFRAADGWFVVQVGREHEFARLAELVGEPAWVDDPRFATRSGWREHIDVIRDAVNRWASTMSNIDACHAMAAAGIAAGPVLSAPQVLADPISPSATCSSNCSGPMAGTRWWYPVIRSSCQDCPSTPRRRHRCWVSTPTRCSLASWASMPTPWPSCAQPASSAEASCRQGEQPAQPAAGTTRRSA